MEMQHEWTAEELINASVDAGGSSNQIISRIDVGVQELSAAEQQKAQRYINGIQEETKGAVVKNLDPGVGGLYDGSDQVKIATGILYVHSSIDNTIAQVEETREHEDYHLQNDHLKPLNVVADTRGDIAAVIGGVEFTQTEIIEGLTVMQTGDQFVSVEYVDHQDTLQQAMNNADLGISDIENAVNKKKDLTLIDDRAQAPEQIAA